MVRGLRRSYSCVVCFLCMPSAMMVTGVSVHTSVAQLASTSSSVSSCLTNSLRDNELDKQHEQKLHGTRLPRFLYLAKCPPPDARPRQITGTCLSGKADRIAGFWKKRFKSLHKKNRTWEKMVKVADLSCRNFLST